MNQMNWTEEKSAAEALRHLESPNALMIKVADRKLVGLLNELADGFTSEDVEAFPSLTEMIKKMLTNVKNRFSIPHLFLVATFTKRQCTVTFDPKTKTWEFRIERRS